MIKLPKSSINATNAQIRQTATLYRTLLVREFSVLVQQLTNDAIQKGAYKDRTGNLRSSIGGVILENGRPIREYGFENIQGPNTNDGQGNLSGKAFLDELKKQHSQGFVMIIVAGMKYAAWVENLYSLNVLASSRNLMLSRIPKIMKNIKTQLEKKRV